MGKKLLPGDWVDEDTGEGHHYYHDSDGDICEEIIDNYEDIYGPGGPDDTGEYYDEWMPKA